MRAKNIVYSFFIDVKCKEDPGCNFLSRSKVCARGLTAFSLEVDTVAFLTLISLDPQGTSTRKSKGILLTSPFWKNTEISSVIISHGLHHGL